MSLAKEEAKTITMWRSSDGTQHKTKHLAEIHSIATIIDFRDDDEDLDVLLANLTSHDDLRKWLLGQIADQAAPKASTDEPSAVEDLPSKLVEYYDKCTHIESLSIRIREVGIRLEQDGYQLIKL